jgi:hypothetical protein
MPRAFEDIRIEDLNIDRCYKSGTSPFMYNMYLALSGNPPSEWLQIFAQERRIPRHRMWRHAWIEHNYIVVDCVPEDLEQYLLKDLKEDVRNSNEKYRAHLAEKEEEIRMKGEAKKKEKERLRVLRNRLDFSI